MGFTVLPIEKVRAALDLAQDRGAKSIEDACSVAARELGIAVEAVREVADQLADQQSTSGAE